MTDKIENNTQESTEQTTQATAEQQQLSISDLQLTAQIVDLATRRGAFHATELSQVGAAYTKLASFLRQVESAKAAGGSADQGAEAFA